MSSEPLRELADYVVELEEQIRRRSAKAITAVAFSQEVVDFLTPRINALQTERQAAFESGRQVKAGHVTRIIAELNDTWKELEHAGFTLLAAKVSTLAKELSNMIERSLAQPAASAMRELGYCDRHRWLHEKDRGPSLPPLKFPCQNWQPASAGSREGQPGEAFGTQRCPICGSAEPHRHDSDKEIYEYLEHTALRYGKKVKVIPAPDDTAHLGEPGLTLACQLSDVGSLHRAAAIINNYLAKVGPTESPLAGLSEAVTITVPLSESAEFMELIKQKGYIVVPKPKGAIQ